MCGIAGILSPDSIPLDAPIQRMQIALQHRGSDDQGIYISPNHQAALAHTRLAILDLSPAGHQPMSTHDGRYHITFNGEIYNFQALRSQLIQQGEIFCSQTDTEVILKLYQRVGSNCIKQLRGMFAFAIWDDQAACLTEAERYKGYDQILDALLNIHYVRCISLPMIGEKSPR